MPLRKVTVVHQISHSTDTGTAPEALYRRLTQRVPAGPRAVVLEECPVKTSPKRKQSVTGCLSRTPNPDSDSFDNPASSLIFLQNEFDGLVSSHSVSPYSVTVC